jgi:hypothetical protein
MRRLGHFRFAHRLDAWIEVVGGRIVNWGQSGEVIMGLTRLSLGRLRILIPAKGNPVIRHSPTITPERATFVQTAGGRPGFSFLKPTVRWPFLVTHPFTIWTTIELTIGVDGGCSRRFIGASPFPRHWLYDGVGHSVQKTALTRWQMWQSTVFGSHNPWGNENQTPQLSEAETELDRALAAQLMDGSNPSPVRHLQAGEYLYEMGAPGDSVALILDGKLQIQANGEIVGEIGPGAIIGEGAALKGGYRTAAVQAITDVRFAETQSDRLEHHALTALAQGRSHDSLGTSPVA